MATRRQGLSQRRKAVGLTQESLAQRLGVERSTVVRWEAGDTEPLPPIRPNLAHVLQVSVDQLAELLTESENADATRAPSADTEVTIPMLLPEVQSEVRPGQVELEDLIPQVAETVEALRRALRSAGVVREDLNAMLLASGSSQVPLVAQLLSAELGGPVAIHVGPQPASVDVRPDRHRAKARRFKRLAAAGLLVLAGAAASAPFVSSHRAPIPPTATGTTPPATPVAAIPVPNPGNNNSPRGEDSTGATHTTPAADGPAPPEAAAVPAPHTTRATSDNQNTNRSKYPAVTPPGIPAIPGEAYAWSHPAPLSAGDQRRARLRPQLPTLPGRARP